MNYEDREVQRVSEQLAQLLVSCLGDRGNDVMGLLEEYVTARLEQQTADEEHRKRELERY